MDQKTKTIVFDTGVTIQLEAAKVNMRSQNENNFIEGKSLDNLFYREESERKFSPIALWFRLSLICGVVFIFGIFAVDEPSTKGVSAGFIMWVITLLLPIIYWVVFLFDLLLELGIFNRIMEKYFSITLYKVTIGNKSGNNINFYTTLDEESKILEIKKGIEAIKENIKVLAESQKTNTTELTPANGLEDLRKLDSLLKDGIITQDEFDTKKKLILGL
jgi:hypothetical protein